jgi:hypothetical protein
MCDCKSRIETRLLETFKEQHPEATGHEVSLKGYAFLFGKTVTLKGCMQVERAAIFPLKKGGVKRKAEKISLMFNLCPFCGEKYEKEDCTQETLKEETLCAS